MKNPKYDVMKTQFDWCKVRTSLHEIQQVVSRASRGWQRHDDGTTSWTGETPEGDWVYASWSADPRGAMRTMVKDVEVPSVTPEEATR